MTNYSDKVLVTGGAGQLALALKAITDNTQYHFASKEALDITKPNAIAQALATIQPSIVVNTAAYTAVDKAETELASALAINHIGAKNLALACAQAGMPLLHISTDYVFAGDAQQPYKETDTLQPINAYGQTKMLGEEAIREHCDQHLILRVSGIFSEYKQNFLKTMLRLAQEKDTLSVVADQLTCPTYAGDIATAITQLVKNLSHFGTYHFCSMPATSWFEFADDIITTGNNVQPLNIQHISKTTADQYPTPAKRPSNSVLDCEKIKLDYGIQQPQWKNAVAQIVPKIIKGM